MLHLQAANPSLASPPRQVALALLPPPPTTPTTPPAAAAAGGGAGAGAGITRGLGVSPVGGAPGGSPAPAPTTLLPATLPTPDPPMPVAAVTAVMAVASPSGAAAVPGSAPDLVSGWVGGGVSVLVGGIWTGRGAQPGLRLAHTLSSNQQQQCFAWGRLLHSTGRVNSRVTPTAFTSGAAP